MCEHDIILGKWKRNKFGDPVYYHEEWYTCAGSNFALFDPSAKPCNKVIKRVSLDYFEETGWVRTQDPYWSKDGKWVLVCPECLKEKSE